MFCSKCGNALEDSAKFCDKCGQQTGNGDTSTNVTPTKVIDDVIQLSLKPKYKSLYFLWGTYVTMAFVLILCIILSASTEFFSYTMIGGLIFCLILFINRLIALIFRKKQLECMRYDFYKTKINYSDSFLNKREKEVKYKYFRECSISRRISDRIFGFGSIILHTSAEGFSNGIIIPYLEDSENVYKQIKQLLDD